MRPLTATLLLCLMMAAGIGCKQEASSTSSQPAPEVEVVEVVQKDVPIYSEWVGTTEGLVNAKIRAQVSGYLVKRPYTEGSFVKKGELLFELDPSKFKAALDQAQGDLAKAQALLLKTKLDVERDTPLAKQGAISQKELDDSVQAYAAAKGSVAAAKAAVEQAKLQSQLDQDHGADRRGRRHRQGADRRPYRCQHGVDLDVHARSAAGVFSRQRTGVPQGGRENSASVQHAGEDQKARLDSDSQRRLDLSAPGKIFSCRPTGRCQDRHDSSRGDLPQPRQPPPPGQYARVRAVTKTHEGALLVPQRAVSELQGNYQVAVVKPDNTVELRPVQVGERIGSMWIISRGLQPGERVVVEGLQKLKAGMTVTPTPYSKQPGSRTELRQNQRSHPVRARLPVGVPGRRNRPWPDSSSIARSSRWSFRSSW